MCHTFLHVARVKKPTALRESRATKSDTSGHCLGARARARPSAARIWHLGVVSLLDEAASLDDEDDVGRLDLQRGAEGIVAAESSAHPCPSPYQRPLHPIPNRYSARIAAHDHARRATGRAFRWPRNRQIRAGVKAHSSSIRDICMENQTRRRPARGPAGGRRRPVATLVWCFFAASFGPLQDLWHPGGAVLCRAALWRRLARDRAESRTTSSSRQWGAGTVDRRWAMMMVVRREPSARMRSIDACRHTATAPSARGTRRPPPQNSVPGRR